MRVFITHKLKYASGLDSIVTEMHESISGFKFHLKPDGGAYFSINQMIISEDKEMVEKMLQILCTKTDITNAIISFNFVTGEHTFIPNVKGKSNNSMELVGATTIIGMEYPIGEKDGKQ